jgi:hypothetical protein
VVQKDAKGRGYSIFRAAAEEAAIKTGDTLRRADEGGHMSCTSGRIVSRLSAGMLFTAVMTREDGTTFEVDFATRAMRRHLFGAIRPPHPPDRRRTTTIAISTPGTG